MVYPAHKDVTERIELEGFQRNRLDHLSSATEQATERCKLKKIRRLTLVLHKASLKPEPRLHEPVGLSAFPWSNIAAAPCTRS
jgi:hypothetical protein